MKQQEIRLGIPEEVGKELEKMEGRKVLPEEEP